MADAMKVDFFFELGKYGWSEKWFNSGADHTTVLARAQNYLDARLPLSPQAIRCTYVRVSDPKIKGDSRIILPIAGGSKGQGSAVPDVPWNTVIVRVDAGPLYRRSLSVRGVADDQVYVDEQNRVQFNSGQTQAAWNKFRKELVDGNWAVRAITKVINPKKIFHASTETPILCTTTEPHGLTSGDSVTISRAKGMTYLNGRWTVNVKSATTFELNESAPNVLPLYQDNTAIWYPHLHDYFDVDKAEVRKITSRDTGRPFDSSHGRRSKRRKVA